MGASTSTALAEANASELLTPEGAKALCVSSASRAAGFCPSSSSIASPGLCRLRGFGQGSGEEGEEEAQKVDDGGDAFRNEFTPEKGHRPLSYMPANWTPGGLAANGSPGPFAEPGDDDATQNFPPPPMVRKGHGSSAPTSADDRNVVQSTASTLVPSEKEKENQGQNRPSVGGPARRLSMTSSALEGEDLVPSKALQIMLNSPGDISDYYTVCTVLGEGNFGKVRRAVVKATGAARAVKSIPKAKRKKHGQEVIIMKMIDHPNLVMLYEIFEDAENLHLVMELCMGGHLLDCLGSDGMSEVEAAVTMQQILRAVSYMHNEMISHRDVKAENCLIAGREPLERARVKVGDFGLSARFRPGQVWNARVGTPTHWAPEVLDRKYSKECDVWASGVVMYQLLCGTLPFSDENDCAQVREGALSFAGETWRKISCTAVELVSDLLLDEVPERPAAGKALKHNWFFMSVPKSVDATMKPEHLERLKTFRSMNRLKRAALTVVTTMLGDRDISAARKLFLALDLNGDGYLSADELRTCLANSGDARMENTIIDPIFQVPAESGKQQKPFSYTEFVTAIFARDRWLGDSICKAAFRNFDKNGDGKLTLENLASGKLVDKMCKQDVVSLLQELGLDCNSSIDFQEFAAMLRGGRRLGKQASPKAEHRRTSIGSV